MLTDAQYRALNAWPDGIPAWPEFKSIMCFTSIKKLYCRERTLLALVKKGIVSVNSRALEYRKIEPACINAIKEYEEAQE